MSSGKQWVFGTPWTKDDWGKKLRQQMASPRGETPGRLPEYGWTPTRLNVAARIAAVLGHKEFVMVEAAQTATVYVVLRELTPGVNPALDVRRLQEDLPSVLPVSVALDVRCLTSESYDALRTCSMLDDGEAAAQFLAELLGCSHERQRVDRASQAPRD